MMNKKANPFAPVVDPVCKMKIQPMKAAGKFEYQGKIYYFCNLNCREKFAADPEKYLNSDAAEPCCSAPTVPASPLAKMLVTDPVCKMTFPPAKAADKMEYQGKTYYFCNPNCKVKFAAEPELYLSGKAPAAPCCCCAEAFEDDDAVIDKRLKKLRNGFIAAGVITLVLILLGHCGNGSAWSRYVQWVLATLAVFGPGGFLLKRGLQSLQGFKLNMFTLISMGISAAYFYSVYALFFAGTLPQTLLNANGSAQLHFAPAAMIAALVILGQYLEGKASSGAGQAVRSLMELVPPEAHRIKCCGGVEDIPLDQVQVGDTLKVLPFDKIPVDGVVIEGSGVLDESMLTGESLPVDKAPGSRLAAGTVNGSSVLIMKTSAVGSDTLLAQIVELVRSARNTRLPVQKLADKVSAVFVPAVLAAALTALIYWGFFAGNWSMALGNFIAVLLAACPCALGLAAPLAVTVGIGTGARHGILIKDPSVLENLRKVDTIMLDKTGTLTENNLTASGIKLADNVAPEEFFIPLMALEQNSNHPLAQAVMAMVEAAAYKEHLPAVSDLKIQPGLGLSGMVNDCKYYLGSLEFMQHNQLDTAVFATDDTQLDGRSIVCLGANGRVLGKAEFSAHLRSDAAEVVCDLKMHNITPVILSGDNPSAVKAVAYQLGIEEFYASLTPQQKLEKVKARQSFGRCTAMLGDGVNDAAALAAADVGIAVGSGTDAALANAGVVLLAGNIGKLGSLLQLSRAVNDTIKLNLMLAFVYNIMLIPLAAGFFYELIHWQVSPVICSLAMSGSCLLVVSNSLRLRKLALRK